MRPAIVRARRPSGCLATFLADHAELRGPFLVAVGHWSDAGNRIEIAWPAQRLLEVRWPEAA